MLISAEYLKMQQELHKIPSYGSTAIEYASLVKNIFEMIEAKTLSDYGAGKCRLKTGLNNLGLNNFEYYPFDPAFPEYGEPKPADLVCCIDVLEHIEPNLIDNTISKLAEITKNIGFFSIALVPAKKFLSDGRNAHLIVKPTSYWLPKLAKFFEVIELKHQNIRGNINQGFWVIVRPKDNWD